MGRLTGTRRRSLVLVALVLGAIMAVQVGAIGASPRTVIIIDPRHVPASSIVQSRLCTPSPRCENGRDGINVVEWQSGALPASPALATVVTDTDCAPDPYGISHCRNVLRLPNGGRVVVRHSHNMQVYACLTPGETVRVTVLR